MTTSEDNSLVQHALEYLGSVVGREGSLRDIYDFFVSYGMSPDLAWKRSSRHKFGFIDTSLPGDIMKPAMYFAYERQIEKLTSIDKTRLFIGKIGIGDLPKYPVYRGIWSKEKLINYFKL